MSAGDSILAHRDRAIVKLYLYTGIRLATGCSLLVEDFRQEGEEATLRLREKGDKRRTIGLHYAAAQAIHEYLQRAELTSVRSSGRAGIPIPRNWRRPPWSPGPCGPS